MSSMQTLTMWEPGHRDPRIARAAASSLLEAQQRRRQAEADELAHLALLAEHYCVSNDEGLDSPAALMEAFHDLGGEGTPGVSEFAKLEVAALLGCSTRAAVGRMVEALNLKHRHPALHTAVQELRVEARRAAQAVRACAQVDLTLADQITTAWIPRQHKLGWKAAMDLLDELIQDFDVKAAERERQAQLNRRRVHFHRLQDGGTCLEAELAPLDAKVMQATVRRITDILETDGIPGTRAQLEVRALGMLGAPALALATLQRGANQPQMAHDEVRAPSVGGGDGIDPVDESPEPLGHLVGGAPFPPRDEHHWQALAAADPPEDPWPEEDQFNEWRASYEITRLQLPILPPGDPPCDDPPPDHRTEPDAEQTCSLMGLAGHVCGAIEGSPHQLQPAVRLAVHVKLGDLLRAGHGDGPAAAVIDDMGAVALGSLKHVLGEDRRVTIQPVIDLNTIPAEHQYRPSLTLATAVTQVFPTEAFPFSSTPSHACDLDHTEAWQARDRSRPQTALGNLAPLSRTVHRAKTAGHWKVDQHRVGVLDWTSPLGYRYRVAGSGTTRLTGTINGSD